MHFWFICQYGDGGGDYTQELWACWAVSRFCDADWEPPDDLHESDSYQLGRLLGGVWPGRRRRGRRSTSCSQGCDGSWATCSTTSTGSTTRLSSPERWPTTGARPSGGSPRSSSGAATSPPRRLRRRKRREEARPGALGLGARDGRREQAEVLEALAGLEAAARWRDEHVTGFGGRGGSVSSDLLLDAAIARLAAANERAGEALAALSRANDAR